MLFSVFYVGDSCQGWGREFESLFPLQIQKALIGRLGLFLLLILYVSKLPTWQCPLLCVLILLEYVLIFFI